MDSLNSPHSLNSPFRFFDTRFCDQTIGLLHDLLYQPVKNLFKNTMTRLLRLTFIWFVCFAHFRMCYVTLKMSLKHLCGTCLAPLMREMITFPSPDRDMLLAPPSFLDPVYPSQLARSIKCSRERPPWTGERIE